MQRLAAAGFEPGTFCMYGRVSGIMHHCRDLNLIPSQKSVVVQYMSQSGGVVKA